MLSAARAFIYPRVWIGSRGEEAGEPAGLPDDGARVPSSFLGDFGVANGCPRVSCSLASADGVFGRFPLGDSVVVIVAGPSFGVSIASGLVLGSGRPSGIPDTNDKMSSN